MRAITYSSTLAYAVRVALRALRLSEELARVLLLKAQQQHEGHHRGAAIHRLSVAGSADRAARRSAKRRQTAISNQLVSKAQTGRDIRSGSAPGEGPNALRLRASHGRKQRRHCNEPSDRSDRPRIRRRLVNDGACVARAGQRARPPSPRRAHRVARWRSAAPLPLVRTRASQLGARGSHKAQHGDATVDRLRDDAGEGHSVCREPSVVVGPRNRRAACSRGRAAPAKLTGTGRAATALASTGLTI